MKRPAVSDIPRSVLEKIVAEALEEDVGRGDATTRAVVPDRRLGSARIMAGAPLVVAGQQTAATVFRCVDADLRYSAVRADGKEVAAGAVVATVSGACASVLTAERTALNFLQRLCGIATLARRAVERVRGTATVLLDTRKTTPGLRVLEKMAARAGGLHPHRSGLDDGILIKDNHIACCGSAAAAVRLARQAAGALLKVEVEIDRLEDLEAVVQAGADIVLLDNFQPDQVAEAVRRAAGRVPLEASGGITLETLPAYAATGVDRISVGFVTHSAPAADLSLELTPGS